MREKSLFGGEKQDRPLCSASKGRALKTNGVFPKPSDMHSIVSVRTKGIKEKPAHILYDEDKIDHLLNSSLSASFGRLLWP